LTPSSHYLKINTDKIAPRHDMEAMLDTFDVDEKNRQGKVPVLCRGVPQVYQGLCGLKYCGLHFLFHQAAISGYWQRAMNYLHSEDLSCIIITIMY
jgi:hypothetical protein